MAEQRKENLFFRVTYQVIGQGTNSLRRLRPDEGDIKVEYALNAKKYATPEVNPVPPGRVEVLLHLGEKVRDDNDYFEEDVIEVADKAVKAKGYCPIDVPY